MFQKFSFPDCRFGRSLVKSERSGSDIPVLRPNHNHVSSVDGKRVTFPFSKHMAALLETVPELQTVLSG